MYYFAKLKFLFSVNLHKFVKRYEAIEDDEPIWKGKWDKTAYKYDFSNLFLRKL